jgi:YD repeat-containing protein
MASSVCDTANRLTTSVSPLGTTTFTYDANNRRAQMIDAGGNITTYTWTDETINWRRLRCPTAAELWPTRTCRWPEIHGSFDILHCGLMPGRIRC